MCLAEKYARTIICRSVVKKSVTFLAKSGVFGVNEQQTAATNRHLRTDVCVQTFSSALISHDHISKIVEFTGGLPCGSAHFVRRAKGVRIYIDFRVALFFDILVQTSVRTCRLHSESNKMLRHRLLLLPVRLPICGFVWAWASCPLLFLYCFAIYSTGAGIGRRAMGR